MKRRQLVEEQPKYNGILVISDENTILNFSYVKYLFNSELYQVNVGQMFLDVRGSALHCFQLIF